jgi:hypothetical protein
MQKAGKALTIKSIIICFLLVVGFSSCMAANQSNQSEAVAMTIKNTATPEATKTFTPEPTATNTPTLVPTPMGGTKLLVAYLSRDCEAINTKNCIAISDFFEETILYYIPLSDATMETRISWSPNGRYLMYQDTTDKKYDINIMIYDTVLTQARILFSQPIDLPPFQSYYEGELVTTEYVGDNSLRKPHWTADNKFVAYGTMLDAMSYQTNVLSLDSGENKIVREFFEPYYWLDDQRSLIQIKKGNLYNAETDEITKVEYAYFMNVSFEYEDYIISYKGKNPSKPDEIYFYPYVKDRNLIIEKGTGLINDGEFLFAKFDYDNEERWPSININSLFVQGDKVIFSGTAYLYEPYEAHRYQYSGNMADVPFMLTLDDFSDEGYDGCIMISVSPDGKLYLTQQTLFIDNTTKQSFLTVNDMETGEELDTFDFHTLGKEMHEIDYVDGKNMAIYWERE